jgi:hypothetical protein
MVRNTETSIVATPRGAAVEVLSDVRRDEPIRGAVILAGGTNYSTKFEIFDGITQWLVERGVAVFRFEWAYRVANPLATQHSPDRSEEIEDFEAVLGHVREVFRVPFDRLALGGKSLGSIVAWNIFRRTPEIRAIWLCTPIGKPQPSGPRLPRENYPGIEEERRASLWMLAAEDAVCPLPGLYAHLATSDSQPRVVALEPEAGLMAAAVDRLRPETLDSVVEISAGFLKRVLVPAELP